MTVIPCANSDGRVVLDEDNVLVWHINDEDGLGVDVWHLAIPPDLLRDLGGHVVQLVEVLAARGLGLAVQGTNDRDQQRARWVAADFDGWR
jgi:hypothetical protein